MEVLSSAVTAPLTTLAVEIVAVSFPTPVGAVPLARESVTNFRVLPSVGAASLMVYSVPAGMPVKVCLSPNFKVKVF